MNPGKQVKDWLEEAISRDRRDEETELFRGMAELYDPCQFEVFWIGEPVEGQLIFLTHDPERGDKEILVHGPYDGPSFIDKMEQIVDSSRWKKSVPPPVDQKPGHGLPPRWEILAGITSKFIEQLEQSIFIDDLDVHPFFRMSKLWGDTYYFSYMGNVAEYEIDSPSIDEEVEDGPDEESEDTDPNGVTPDGQSKQEAVTAGGGYIYEPVWIEKAPERSFSDLVWDNQDYQFDNVYSTEFSGVDFHAYRDGLLLLSSEDGGEIIKILNTLFGVGIFFQFRTWRTLLDRELYSGEIREGEIEHASYEISTPSGRGQLIEPDSRPPDVKRSLLRTDKLKRFIKIAEVIYPIHNVRERTILHLKAHTHLLDDEFDASFALNWTVVEQLIDDFLKDHIPKDHKLEWEDKGLEFAEISGIIDMTEYELLDKHRDNRNSIIHEMESVDVRQSEELDMLVSKLLVRDINMYLEEQNISPINHRLDPVKFPNRKPEVRKELIESILSDFP